MLREVFFDAETQKLFNEIHTDDPADLGLSVVSVYARTIDDHMKEIEGRMQSFWEDDLEAMWDIFTQADRIVGFNSINFDVPLLDRYAPFSFGELKHFDLLDEIRAQLGHRLSLNVLARDTLGKSKSDIGTNAVLYWKRGDTESLDKLRSYCEHDVYITRDLYDYALANKRIQYKDKWNNMQTVALDFSYPPASMVQPKNPDDQLGLW